MEQINEGKTCVAQRVLTAPTAAPSKHVRLLWNAHPPSLSTIQLLGVSPTTCSSTSPTCLTLNLALRLSACIRRRMATTPSEAVNNTAKWVSERLSRLLVQHDSFRFRQSGPLLGKGYQLLSALRIGCHVRCAFPNPPRLRPPSTRTHTR